jgi:hypothetical protein
LNYNINPLTPELNSSVNAVCHDFSLGISIFKGLTARRFYKSFGVKGLKLFKEETKKTLSQCENDLETANK